MKLILSPSSVIFNHVAPIAVGVNLTCIRSKLVKKHSSMREAISKIFSKGMWGEGNGDICLKPWLNIFQFCYSSQSLYRPAFELTGMMNWKTKNGVNLVKFTCDVESSTRPQKASRTSKQTRQCLGFGDFCVDGVVGIWGVEYSTRWLKNKTWGL